MAGSANPGAVCTGSPSSCTIGAVGLSNGSSITGAIREFDMQLDYPSGVLPTAAPESTSIVLLATALAAIGAWERRRRTRDA